MWILVKGSPVNLSHFAQLYIEPVKAVGRPVSDAPIAYQLRGGDLMGASATLYEGKTFEECQGVLAGLFEEMQKAGMTIPFKVQRFGTDKT